MRACCHLLAEGAISGGERRPPHRQRQVSPGTAEPRPQSALGQTSSGQHLGTHSKAHLEEHREVSSACAQFHHVFLKFPAGKGTLLAIMQPNGPQGWAGRGCTRANY